MTTKKLLLLSLLIFFKHTSCMHHAIVPADWYLIPLDLKTEIASNLNTLADYAAFSRTCKEHSENINVDKLLFTTNLPHYLSCSDYTKTLIHYSENFEKFSHL